jgi:hypothetical protein
MHVPYGTHPVLSSQAAPRRSSGTLTIRRGRRLAKLKTVELAAAA